jgi:hypothetical protein
MAKQQSSAWLSRFRKAWHVFRNSEEISREFSRHPPSYISTTNPLRLRSLSSERTFLSSIQTRIAMDVAAYDFKHVRVDEHGHFKEIINSSSLHNCLTVEANLDQSGRAFIQDLVMSMMDEGSVAIVPIETDPSILMPPFEIYSLRVGKIVDWYPDRVNVDVYNDQTGVHDVITLPKKVVGIIENPLYSVMNEPNSTMSRLNATFQQIDILDNQHGSGKLDLIIQLPYAIKSEGRLALAEKKRQNLEEQLESSRYGIGYIDGTERITQLNRPVENNLLERVKYLTETLYSQLGITEGVFVGTADEKAILNYYNRTIEPIATAIMEELSRKFLTKTARSQGQAIRGFQNSFRLVPQAELAEIANLMTRNEIMTPNEVRSIMGMPPSGSSESDKLRNRNMPPPQEGGALEEVDTQEYDDIVNELLQGLEGEIDTILAQVG